jgi:hypothetical protein
MREEMEMTDITKLADDWISRNFDKRFNDGEPICPVVCAEELTQALPVWTRITDDPKTWPAHFQKTVSHNGDDGGPFYFFNLRAQLEKHDYINLLYWRPLCSLDYPPETES